MGVHIDNPHYLGGGDQEDHSSRSVWAKSQQNSISTNKLGVMVHACHPNYAGRIGRKITVQGQLQPKSAITFC
jgi:hypothetical protein